MGKSKKVLSLILVIMMIVSIVPLGMFDVYAANVTINGIDLGYSDGSYFTKNGEACTCHGRGTCGEVSDCNCKVVSGTCQCYGWSLWVENKLFGSNDVSNASYFKTAFSNYSNCTGSGLYSKMNNNVGIGAHIRTSSSKKGYAHSVSVMSFDSNGINITDCNHSGKCQIDVRYYSWDSFATFMNGYGGISFVKTCNNAPIPQPRTIDESYGHNFSATCNAKHNTLTSSYSTESNRYIDAGDVCTIHDVYTDGYCYLTYPAGSTTRQAYGRIEWFSFTKPNQHIDLGDEFMAIIYPSQRSHVEVIGNNNGNAELVEEKGNSNERWRFEKTTDGSYYIRSMLDGGYLDVTGAYTSNGTNIQVRSWTDSDAQRWYICEGGYGYQICPKHCNSSCLDCTEGIITYGSNIQLYEKNKTKAQGFNIYKIDNQVDVRSGIYKIHSAWNDNQLLDISGNSKENNANIQLYEKENTDVQKFRIIKHDGYYTIKSVYADKYLDIDLRTGQIANNSNVQLWNSDQSTGQKWVFERAENGLVYIKSLTGYYLDVQGDNAVNNANIQVYEFMGNNSQKWRLERINYPKPTFNSNKNSLCKNNEVQFTYNNVSNADEVKIFYEKGGNVVNSAIIFKNGSYSYSFKDAGECKTYIGARYGDEWVYSDKITINVSEHNFVDGFCTECGKADYTKVLFGDYNSDGEITNVDSLAATKIGNGSISATYEVKFRMDVNADGTVDSNDAEIILAYVNGKTYKADWQVYDQFSGFTVKTKPKTEYYLGEAFDSTGMILKANYKNGTTHTVSSGYTVSGYNPNKLGEQTVTIDYHGFKATLTVKITIQPGDVNGDGKINAEDLTVIINNLLKGGEYNEAFDANGDGKFDILDIVSLKKHLADNTVPLGK